jgi:hypothetical protein
MGHYDLAGMATCIEFGADYNHLYDDTHRETGVEGVDRYLRDADALAAWLVAKHEEAAK